MQNFDDSHLYSVGSSCINKDWFSAPIDEVWALMEDYLYFIGTSYPIKIYSFVLMRNHFHLLVQSSPQILSLAMQFFLSQTSRLLMKQTDRMHHTWRSRYFRSLIRDERYLLHAYKYFYRNPVEAGICRFVEEYRYSTLHGKLGFSQLVIPVAEDSVLFDNPEDTLRWLNRAPSEENREAMKIALKRSNFKLPRNGDGHRHDLEDFDY